MLRNVLEDTPLHKVQGTGGRKEASRCSVDRMVNGYRVLSMAVCIVLRADKTMYMARYVVHMLRGISDRIESVYMPPRNTSCISRNLCHRGIPGSRHDCMCRTSGHILYYT